MVKNCTHTCVSHRIKTSALELLSIWLGLETPPSECAHLLPLYDGDLFSGYFFAKGDG